jgi:hypothetical protein
VLAPIPSASDKIATKLKSGVRANPRSIKRKLAILVQDVTSPADVDSGVGRRQTQAFNSRGGTPGPCLVSAESLSAQIRSHRCMSVEVFVKAGNLPVAYRKKMREITPERLPGSLYTPSILA